MRNTVMYEHSHPYGFVNISIIKGIARTKEHYYIVDVDSNYLRCSKETYEELSNRGIKERRFRYED